MSVVSLLSIGRLYNTRHIYISRIIQILTTTLQQMHSSRPGYDSSPALVAVYNSGGVRPTLAGLQDSCNTEPPDRDVLRSDLPQTVSRQRQARPQVVNEDEACSPAPHHLCALDLPNTYLTYPLVRKRVTSPGCSPSIPPGA
jgi:hypothetical protein